MFRPYQEIIFQHQLANERCNVWSFMGSGKTLSTLTLLDYLYGCGFESKPTLVIAPLRVARSVWPAEAKKWKHLSLEVSAIVGTEAERLRALKRDVPIYSINYENIPWLTNVLRGKWPFSGVIADECFTAGTMVSTPSGPRAIESLSVGDEVLSHLGPKKIAKRFTRAAYPFKLVSLKLSNGETIHATENHPFFTELGWLPARACRGRRLFSSDDLSVLWQGICQERKCGALQSQAWDPAILLTQLPHIAHVSASAGDAQKRVGDDGENTKNNGYILEQRSSMVEGATEFDVASSQSSGPIANGEGREWQGNVSERGFDLPLSTQGLYLELRSVVGEEGTWVSQQLQSGLWQPCEANIFGDRWQLPHYQSGQGTGREERPETTVIGVARYSDLKQRSMETTYDLEIEDAHTYFAGGVLVHNCTKLKGHRLNSGGLRAGALARVAHETSRWINLTGTPSPNGLIDLWGQQWFVDGGARLGKTFTAFKERWFYPHPSGYGTKAHDFAQEQIQARLSDCTLSVKAEDWFTLDAPIVTDIYVDMPDKAMKLYKQMEKEMYIEVAGAGVEAFNSASMTMKCLQLANGAIYNQDASKWDSVHDAKLEALDEIVEESGAEPIIVVYQFKHDLARIKARFKQARELKTADDETAWNEGRIPILVLHPESAGHGLNLQDGGNRIVFFGHWWSLEPYQQVIERIGPVRQMQSGHNRNVFIYHLLARSTLDEEVMRRRTTKASVQDLLLNAMRRAA